MDDPRDRPEAGSDSSCRRSITERSRRRWIDPRPISNAVDPPTSDGSRTKTNSASVSMKRISRAGRSIDLAPSASPIHGVTLRAGEPAARWRPRRFAPAERDRNPGAGLPKLGAQVRAAVSPARRRHLLRPPVVPAPRIPPRRLPDPFHPALLCQRRRLTEPDARIAARLLDPGREPLDLFLGLLSERQDHEAVAHLGGTEPSEVPPERDPRRGRFAGQAIGEQDPAKHRLMIL
jgi:hypothetical protein